MKRVVAFALTVLPGVVLFATCVPSCAPETPPTSRGDSVHPVDVRAIYNSYRDDSNRWTGFRVSVVLDGSSYSLGRKGIEWSAGAMADSPDILFECTRPQTNTQPLVVTGRCRGKMYRKEPDALGPSNQWYVRVSECEWVAVSR